MTEEFDPGFCFWLFGAATVSGLGLFGLGFEFS
jgi:hypothetical protein